MDSLINISFAWLMRYFIMYHMDCLQYICLTRVQNSEILISDRKHPMASASLRLLIEIDQFNGIKKHSNSANNPCNPCTELDAASRAFHYPVVLFSKENLSWQLSYLVDTTPKVSGMDIDKLESQNHVPILGRGIIVPRTWNGTFSYKFV